MTPTPKSPDQSKPAQLLRVIACEIAVREISFAIARSRNIADVDFLDQGYHDTPVSSRAKIQQRIDAVPAGKYDAILLGYGLCSNILVGLTATHTPLVIPRAHDCITFFLGSKERYQQFFTSHPGSYYYTAGWLECRRRRQRLDELLQATRMDLLPNYQEWVEKYGEDQAQYLAEVMSGWSENYGRGVLISFDFAKNLGLREQVQRLCDARGWKFEEVEGDMRLLQRWLDGDWPDEDFQIVRPGEKVVATYDEKIIGVQPAAGV